MKLPSAQITSRRLEKWFTESGCVRRRFYPPEVPSPPAGEELFVSEPSPSGNTLPSDNTLPSSDKSSVNKRLFDEKKSGSVPEKREPGPLNLLKEAEKTSSPPAEP